MKPLGVAAPTRGEGIATPSAVPRVVPLRRPERWVVRALLLLAVAMALRSAFSNKGFQWSVVGRYLFNRRILGGVSTTIQMTVLSLGIGAVVGLAVAGMRLSKDPVLRWVGTIYVTLFRSIPIVVQLLFWFYLAALFPTLSLGVPFGLRFITFNTNHVITQLVAAMLGLGLFEAAYIAEIVRGGITAIPMEQIRAAESLGMTKFQTMRHIVLPQAVRVIIPPMGNETISAFKGTAVLVVIAYQELLTTAQQIYTQNFETIPLLIVVCIWYFSITSLLTVGQQYLERRLAFGSRAAAPARPVGGANRWRMFTTGGR